ncbi:retrotransposon protein, putative, ty1-copia subclass [Tanacetum coccineum]
MECQRGRKSKPCRHGSSMMTSNYLYQSPFRILPNETAVAFQLVPSKQVDKTRTRIYRHGQAPKLSYLRVWGCEAFVKHDTLTKPDKLDPRSFKSIFIGYPKETMGYSFYSPSENKVFVARNAEFFESKLLDLKASPQGHAAFHRSFVYVHPRSTAQEHELGDLGEPANYRAALLDPESKKWLDAMNVEMQSMKDNDVCLSLYSSPC